MAIIKTTSNIKSFTRKLDRIAKAIPKALDKGLTRWAVLAHKDAIMNLSGPGLKKSHTPGGAYPVPVRSGHLRRSEGYVAPGRSKAGITARSGQAYLFNTAIYATDIHKGAGKSERHGKREFAKDAIETSRKAGVMAIRTALHEALIR